MVVRREPRKMGGRYAIFFVSEREGARLPMFSFQEKKCFDVSVEYFNECIPVDKATAEMVKTVHAERAEEARARELVVSDKREFPNYWQNAVKNVG